MIADTIKLTPRMRAIEEAEGRPIKEVLIDRYEIRTQEEIAREFGVSGGTISLWFRLLSIPTSHDRTRGQELAAS